MGIIIILILLCGATIALAIIGAKYWYWDLAYALTMVLAVFIGIGAIGCSIGCICVHTAGIQHRRQQA